MSARNKRKLPVKKGKNYAAVPKQKISAYGEKSRIKKKIKLKKEGKLAREALAKEMAKPMK